MKAQAIVPGHLYCVSTLYRRRRVAQLIEAKCEWDAKMALIDMLIAKEKKEKQSCA